MTIKNETPIQRLERLRAQAAARDAKPPAASAQLRLPQPGEVVHSLISGNTVHTGAGGMSGGVVIARGDALVVTAAMLEAARTASGEYRGVALVHEPERQIALYGEQRFAPGPAPVDMLPEVGTAEWRQAREEARTAAWQQPDPDARAAALRRVNERFGSAPETSIHWKVDDPTIAAAEAQQAALDTGGVRFSMHVEAREAGAQR